MDADGRIAESEIAALIPRFLDEVGAGALVGPVFASAIGNRPPHLEKLMAFWSLMMLTSGRHKRYPLAAHMTVGA